MPFPEKQFSCHAFFVAETYNIHGLC
uniref:Uncharacterized protein n=1 Tax=Arundo donax TaxID=35708 RepID=A0A0A9H2H9_ARUDO